MDEIFIDLNSQFKTDSLPSGLPSGFMPNNSLANPVTGVGTARDPSQYSQIIQPYILSFDERNSIYRSSGICRKIVHTYPEEASWGVFNFGATNYGSNTTEALRANQFFDDLKRGSLHEKFMQASIEARLHKQAYILLGVEDGQSYDKPLNLDGIISFDWAEVLTNDEVSPANTRSNLDDIATPRTKLNISSKEYFDPNPEYYVLKLARPIIPDKDIREIIVHRSRLLRFHGDYLTISTLKETRSHDSSLQACMDGVTKFLMSLAGANAMLSDHSLFWYKVEGLAAMVRAKRFDEIYSKFLTLQMSKSVIQGIALDSRTEEIGFVNRNYAGIDKIIAAIRDFMLAETDLVRYKILGVSQDTGLGGEGRGLQERLQHSLNIKSWQNRNWKNNLLYCLKLAILAQNSFLGSKRPKTYGVAFPPVYELTPLEITELFEKNYNIASKAIQDGVLTELEVRNNLFDRTDPIILPTYILDSRYTDTLEEEFIYEFVDTSPEERDSESDDELNDESENESEDELDEELITDSLSTRNDASDFDLIVEAHNDIEDDILWNVNFDDVSNLEAWFRYTTKNDASYPMLVWFGDKDGSNKHRTGIAVRVEASNPNEARSKAISSARKKCTRHCETAYAVRRATTAEVRTAAKGRWIRTGAKGQPPGYKGLKGVGTPLKNDSQDTELKLDYIEKQGVWYVVKSENGKTLGKYRSKREAEIRLNQVEKFKHMKKDATENQKQFNLNDAERRRVDKYLESIDEINEESVIDSLKKLD